MGQRRLLDPGVWKKKIQVLEQFLQLNTEKYHFLLNFIKIFSYCDEKTSEIVN